MFPKINPLLRQKEKKQKRNVYVVRTKLQLVLADLIINKFYGDDENRIIVTASSNKQIQELVDLALYISKNNQNINIKSISQDCGILTYLMRLFIATSISGPRRVNALLIGSLSCTRLAIFSLLLRPKRLETFDDGSANYQLRSLYFRRVRENSNLRGALKDILLPRGPQGYLRSATQKHYTLHTGAVNVVPRSKRIILECDWANYLLPADAEYLTAKRTQILIGTVFDEAGLDECIENLLPAFLRRDCLAIGHPRELRQQIAGIKFVRLQGCAESIIDLMSKSSSSKVEVFHFGSSVAFTMDQRLDVEFYDLTPENTR